LKFHKKKKERKKEKKKKEVPLLSDWENNFLWLGLAFLADSIKDKIIKSQLHSRIISLGIILQYFFPHHIYSVKYIFLCLIQRIEVPMFSTL
jgi:hypothetical protein